MDRKVIFNSVFVTAVVFHMNWRGYSMRWCICAALPALVVLEVCKKISMDFLSSIMIYATIPFMLNDWIKTNIEGYEVSGKVEHVGWWLTTITGEDGGTIYIPNHKFTGNVVRNPSHWRIKSYIAISPLDFNKIDSIVAGMREVLAKNPHVEQYKLHELALLEDSNPEDQALKILILCFVKTSHFEEYLSVKDAIFLELFAVVSNHQARLATPNQPSQISTNR